MTWIIACMGPSSEIDQATEKSSAGAGPMFGPFARRLGSVISWVSASIAGISAVLYGFGFIASKSADQVLGIGIELASRDPVTHIVRGSSVAMRTVILGIWGFILVFLTIMFIRKVLAWSRLSERQFWQRFTRIALLASPAAISLAMLAAAFFAITIGVSPAFSILETAGVLFTANPTDTMAAAIIAQDRTVLNQTFASFAMILGGILAVGLLSMPLLTAAKSRVWPVLAALSCALGLVSAPIAYGALAVKLRAPTVTLLPPVDGSEPMRLLSRDADGVLLWLETSCRFRWVQGSSITALTVGANQPLTPCQANAPKS